MNTMQGVSVAAIDKGLESIGVKHNEVVVYSKLMDAASLFLTANADTIYFFGILDLTKGPIVFEVPPKALGAVDDYWFRWVTDFGAPGPDRGEGGKISLFHPITMVHCRKAASTSLTPRRAKYCGLAARSWK